MNECVICKKEIKGYDVQYINGKYYHNFCIENLQSKIDKAIEYINNNLITSSILDGKKTYCLNDYSFNYEELLDILKEDKDETNSN